MTASGTSNAEPFSYQPPVRRNVILVPSGDFGVLSFGDLQTVSSDTSRVVEDITIENIARAWYFVHVMMTSGVTGPDLPSEDFMIGPGQMIPLGQVTFPRKNQLTFLADNSIDLRTCTPICDLQTRVILGALAGDAFWRVVTGKPFPVDDLGKLLFLVKTETRNPLINLGIDIMRGDFLGAANDVGEVLADPVTGPLFTSLLETHGFSNELPLWIVIYSRAAQVARLLIETVLYPHVGQLVFNAR